MSLLSLCCPDDTRWDAFVVSYPRGHLLQTSPWGALKAAFGWRMSRLALEKGSQLVAGAQILYRPLLLGLTLAYVPKGPLVDWENREMAAELLTALSAEARCHRAILLLLEPDLPDDPHWTHVLRDLGLRPFPRSIQPRRTILVDLQGSEEDILARMKSKTRYNVRLARRKGVTVRVGGEEDLDVFYRLMQTTAARDGFGIHSYEYYRTAYRLFVPRGWARLFLAEYEGEPLAGLMVFACGEKAWYFFGASSNRHRNLMPNYLLQWEAMRWARERGCTTYDLWGIPDEDETILEAQFTTRRDGLWGVYRFKRGFGGQVVRYVGAWYRIPLLG